MQRSHFAGVVLSISIWIVTADAATGVATPRLPVLFERNTGGDADAFPLLARGKGYALLLGPGEMQLRRAGAGSAVLTFAGASRAPQPIEPSPTLLNDYTGGTKHWTSGAPTWRQAGYRELYPGIDLLFYGDNGEIEYDARVRPGANPSKIAFLCRGVTPQLMPSGDLRLALGTGSVTWRKPVAYQVVDGRQVAVEAWFEVKGRTIHFGTRGWDRRYPLVIDPTLTFSTFLGGSGLDFLKGVAADSSGNVYVAGFTASGDLPVTASSYQSAYKGGGYPGNPADCFIAKLNAAGTALTYVTYLGGTSLDGATAIAADSSGNAYVTGYTDSTDFPITAGAYQTRFGGDTGVFNDETGDAFAAKFDPTGKLVWSTYLGGPDNDLAMAIALDSSGNIIIAGATESSGFPATAGAFQTAFGGGDQGQTLSDQGYVEVNLGDGFVSKLDPTGSKLLASTFLGGKGDDVVGAVTLDSQGNIWVGGATASNNFPTAGGPLQNNYGGASSDEVQGVIQFGDGFISEFSSDLTKLTYSTYLGGSNDDAVTGIAVDGSGNVFVTGFTQSTNFPVKGASAGSYHGPASPQGENPFLLGDAFVAKMTPSAGLISSEYLGGALDDLAAGLALDASGNPVIAGVTNSSDFPTTSGAMQTKYGGVGAFPYDDLGDGFLTQVNASTGALLYSTFFGGSNSDALGGIASDANGNIYVVGMSFSGNFPVTSGVLQPTLNSKVAGTADSVVLKFAFGAAPPPPTLPVIGGTANAASYSTKTYSPGEIVTIFGSNMARRPSSRRNWLPTARRWQRN